MSINLSRLIGVVSLILIISTAFSCGNSNSLQPAIDTLRQEIGSIPTDASNFYERMELLRAWYNSIDDSYATVPTPPGVQGFYDLFAAGRQKAGEEQYRIMDEFLIKMDIVDGKQEQVAAVRISPNEPVRAGDYTTRTLHYVAGPYGMKEGGSFSVHISNQVDMEES